MRSFLAGLFLLALTSAAIGQVRGEVESIGFGNGWYRPESWTPMVVRLESQISEPAEYRIEVHQHDLDFDHVIYVKEGITLNAQATQRWEMCFLPEPIHGGLPDGNVVELQDRLRVFLTNKEGTRQLIQLPITSPVQSLEPHPGMTFDSGKAYKLVLFVMDGSSRPALTEASYDKAIGLVERPLPVPIRPSALPQSLLAYAAVDAVVWISGDAHVLSEQGSKQLTSLQQWVRQGGELIVCQPSTDAERQRLDPFTDILPIQWKENGDWKVQMQEKSDLEPLVTLARPKNAAAWDLKFWHLKGKFAFARANAKPSAVVEASDWIKWDAAGNDQTPYIARIPYGLGSVTWVAQDLGNPSITGPDTAGWPYVWDHIFDWKNDTHLANNQPESVAGSYNEVAFNTAVDLGSAQLSGVEFGAKGAGLIGLAVAFFIVYWIVAGPGSYLFLANKKRKELSWLAYGVAALGATMITVVVVRLVLRGSPEVHHASNVRMVNGQEAQPAIAMSRIGLYIPRDGDQHLGLADTSNQSVSYLTPMSVPPRDGENDFPATLDYRVPVRDEGAAEPVAVDVPFRSTLKKLQAKWCGEREMGVRGNSLHLIPDGGTKDPINGSIDNLTGIDLRNVYVAFHTVAGDQVLYVPSWPAAAGKNRIDLSQEFPKADALPLEGNTEFNGTHPDGLKTCRGDIANQWAFYWHRSIAGEQVDDLHDPIPRGFPILSLFDRVPPPVNVAGNSKLTAYTIYRRGERDLNLSSAVGAGELVVLAQADNQPLPFPLEVNGDKVGGEGTVFYQFVLPLDHSGVFAPPKD
jgi:hypothetical protein